MLLPETPPPPRRSPRRLALGALLAAALVGGWFLARRPGTPAERPASGDVLLDSALAALPDVRRLRVKEPCTLEFAVTPAAGASVDVSFGPPAPAERSPDGAPDPEGTVSWSAKAGDAPHREVVMAPGVYVVRVARHPGEAGTPGGAAIRVRALPAR